MLSTVLEHSMANAEAKIGKQYSLLSRKNKQGRSALCRMHVHPDARRRRALALGKRGKGEEGGRGVTVYIRENKVDVPD